MDQKFRMIEGRVMSLRNAVVALVFLAGCQTAGVANNMSKSSAESNKHEQYQSVIDGGLGIGFGDPISKLVEMGFVENTRPKKQHEVGEWRIPFYKSIGFFNFGMEVSTSPSTGRIYTIQGFRLYGTKNYFDHFSACEEDFTLLRTKIEAKYPSLHKRYGYALNKPKEHSSMSFYEGKGIYQYSASPRYFGRNIDLVCSIQTSDGEIIGSMLFVTYSEDYETKESLRAEQKQIFSSLSGKRLKEKGINANDL